MQHLLSGKQNGNFDPNLANFQKLLLPADGVTANRVHRFNVQGQWLLILNQVVGDGDYLTFDRAKNEQRLGILPGMFVKRDFNTVDFTLSFSSVDIIVLVGQGNVDYNIINNYEAPCYCENVTAGNAYATTYGFNYIYTRSFGQVVYIDASNTIFILDNIPSGTLLYTPNGWSVTAGCTANITIYYYDLSGFRV